MKRLRRWWRNRRLTPDARYWEAVFRHPGDAEARNVIAETLNSLYGYVPFSVRIRAAESAVQIVEHNRREWEERNSG